MMSDEEFLAALESCSLSERDFGHAAHVRAAYLYSRSRDFAAALEKMRRAIRTYAASLGKADRYHETITVAYLALIRQRLFERGDGGGWEGFCAGEPGTARSRSAAALLSRRATRVRTRAPDLPATVLCATANRCG
jgi:hypothetical protein